MMIFSVTDTYTTGYPVDILVETTSVIIPMTTLLGLASTTEAKGDGKFKILAPGDQNIKIDVSFLGVSDEIVFTTYVKNPGGVITNLGSNTIKNFNASNYNIDTFLTVAHSFNVGDLVYFTAELKNGHISVKSKITFGYLTTYSQSGDVTKASGQTLILPESIPAPTVSGKFLVRIGSSFDISNLTLSLSSSGSPKTVKSTSSVISILTNIKSGVLPTIQLSGEVVPKNKSYNATELLSHTTDKKISIAITLIRLS